MTLPKVWPQSYDSTKEFGVYIYSVNHIKKDPI